MTSYTARIVLEGWGDQTIELDQYERDQIIVQIGSAMARKRAEDERREQEKAKARAGENPYFDPDYPFNFTDWANVFSRFSDASSSFGRTRFTHAEPAPPPPPPKPTQRAPAPPVTVTDALDVVSFYSEDAYRKTREELRALLRRAKRKTHPDTGGSSAAFQRVTAAEAILRRAGRI